MKIQDLHVEQREKLGSANARRYRRAGQVPVNLYGRGRPNRNLVTTAEAFAGVLAEHTALVNLIIGDRAQTALVREVRWDVFGDYVQHVDLTRVEMEDEVKLRIPIHTTGVPIGASHGGQLQIVQRDIEVYSRVDSIPSEINIDVTSYEIGDGLHVEEVPYPENVRPAGNPRDLVLQVAEPKAVEEEPVEGEAVEGEAAEGEAAPADAPPSDS